MTSQEYLEERVVDQINWYDRKSLRSQRWFKSLRLVEVLAAAAIPVLVAYVDPSRPAVAGSIAVLGALVAIIAAVLGLYQFEQQWVEYRTTCESLKKERFLFMTEAEPFAGEPEENFSLLVQRVETLISKENTNWAQYMTRPDQGPGAE